MHHSKTKSYKNYNREKKSADINICNHVIYLFYFFMYNAHEVKFVLIALLFNDRFDELLDYTIYFE